MPWLAQHRGGHAHWAEPGSAHEAWLRAAGYVEAAPPGTAPADQVAPEPVQEPAREATSRTSRRRATEEEAR